MVTIRESQGVLQQSRSAFIPDLTHSVDEQLSRFHNFLAMVIVVVISLKFVNNLLFKGIHVICIGLLILFESLEIKLAREHCLFKT